MTLAAALGLLFLVLALPSHPADLTPAGMLGQLPAELPLLVLALVALPARGLRLAVAAVLWLMVVVKLADLAGQAAFLRPFDPILDRHLIGAGWTLFAGAIGLPRAVAALALAGAVLALLAVALCWAAGRIAAAGRRWRGPAAAGLAAGTGLALAGLLPGDSATTRLAIAHAQGLQAARADLATFRAEAAADPWTGARLAGLQGRDVAVIFVESYGRTALEAPGHSPVVRPVLTAAEAALARRGLALRSGWLTAPIAGGQSWLAHATLLSGLRIDSEARYRALIASPRRTLPALAAAQGWDTAAVVPAITRAWPEARYFGYATVLDAHTLGYRGLPFGWVTMPDQYTLAALERLLAARARPVFAMVALISSHAPWTPLPRLLPWEAIGDGAVYGATENAGEDPDSLWRDPARVRQHYAAALAYSLAATLEALGRGGAPALAVVLGDHQPAPFVAGGVGGRDVPVHVIGPPALVDRLADWGWTPGLLPDPALPAWPMEAFRDRFLTAFAEPAPRPGALPAALPH